MVKNISIKENEFNKFKLWLHKIAGIDLRDSKTKLVEGRLLKRVFHYDFNSFSDYFDYISQESAAVEAQIALDLLTTNETYFYREPKHFDYLSKIIIPKHIQGRHFRLWCAASSSGEEPYTLAMTLAEKLASSSWEIVASDISTRVLAKAESGHYAMERAHNIPVHLRNKYCLKGTGSQEGTFLMSNEMRKSIKFSQINLINELPNIGSFDVIFMRNVMIYFDLPTKIKVVERVCQRLKKGGYLFVSHSESLVGLTKELQMVKPSIFIKR